MGDLRRGAAVIACATLLACTPFGSADAPDAGGDAGGDAGARTDGAESGAGSTYVNEVLADHPVGYWRLEELSGTVAVSGVPGGPDATIFGSPLLGQQGAAGNAFVLEGVAGAGLEVPDAFEFAGTAPFTLEAWFRARVIDDTFRHLFTKDSPAAPRQEYGVLVRGNELIFERIVGGGNITVETPLTPSETWRHVVAVFDGAQLALYLDGSRVGIQSETRSQGDKGLPLVIGAKDRNYGTVDGGMDEVAVYDYALSNVRIAAHYAARR